MGLYLMNWTHHKHHKLQVSVEAAGTVSDPTALLIHCRQAAQRERSAERRIRKRHEQQDRDL